MSDFGWRMYKYRLHVEVINMLVVTQLAETGQNGSRRKQNNKSVLFMSAHSFRLTQKSQTRHKPQGGPMAEWRTDMGLMGHGRSSTCEKNLHSCRSNGVCT